jgi:hypothetical protein
VTVLYDDQEVNSGTIRITIDPYVAQNVRRVGTYVTGNLNVTMTAYDLDGNYLDSIETGGANAAPAGQPNKLLELTTPITIGSIVFTNGGSRGNTYTLDDFFFEAGFDCDVADVPLYKQGGSAEWASDPYGGSTTFPWYDRPNHLATVGDWGCAMTAAAMLVSYYADLQDVTPTTPGELNDWLRENEGYSGPSLLWPKVAEFARDVKGIDLYYYEGWGPDNGIINAFLCNSAPVVLQTTSSPYNNGHFVLATGVVNSDSWEVNDPGGYDITSLASQPQKSYRKYGTVEDVPTHLTIAIHPPQTPTVTRKGDASAISIHVIDPAGRILHYDAYGSYENQILDAVFAVEYLEADDGTDNTFATYFFSTGAPLEGEYQIEITSHVSGNFEVDLLGYDSAGDSSSVSTRGYADSGGEVRLDVDYSPEPGSDLELAPEWPDRPALYLPAIVGP